MAKELPYFRFTVQDWQNGKIDLERYELKGLFIDLCGYYWINDCTLTLAMLNKKFSNAKDMIKELIELGIIKHENRHDKVEIEFLNIQYDLLSVKRKLRQDAGSKGGKAKAMLQQKGGYKDKDKDKDKNKDKDKDKEEELVSDFMQVVNEWHEYKKARKESYKTEESKKMFEEKLLELSKNNTDIARQIIKQSMANNWAGIFPLKDAPKPTIKKTVEEGNVW